MYALAVSLVVIYCVYRYFTRTFNYWSNKNVVGPKPFPLFGNTSSLVFQSKFIGTAVQNIYNKYPDQKLVGFYRMTTPILLVRDLDIIKHVLIRDFEAFADRGVDLSKEGLGANLFTLDADSWRVLRMRFSPIFTSGKLKNMFHLISDRGDRFIQSFSENYNENIEYNVLSIARQFTMSTIGACAFGLDIEPDDSVAKVLNKLDKLVFETNIAFEFLLMHSTLLKLFDGAVFPAEVNKFFYDLVKSVFAQRNYKPSPRKDFMDLILEMKQQKVISGKKNSDDIAFNVELTDAVIAAQAFIFYIAGYETSSTTLGFLLYEISHHPEIQDKLIAEIDDALKKCDGIITYDLLMDMPYMSKVFDETLRKYPIADPLQRSALVDYKVPGTDITIKKGQLVNISVAGIHYDEKYYPKPEVFDPERFSPENVLKRHACAYLPFGNGPRNCIGMRFAKVQSRMFLVKLLAKYRVEVSTNTPKSIISDPKRALLGSKQPILLNIVMRKLYV